MLCVITATDGRPEAFGLLARWMASQDFDGPLRWIVSGRKLEGYDLDVAFDACSDRGWDLRRLNPRGDGDPMSRNLAAALDHIESWPGDHRVVALEDDDYYAPGYLSAYDAALAKTPMVGAPNARYYNVRTRRFRRLQNAAHASLAQTGLSGDAIGHARSILSSRPRALQFDRAVWSLWQGPKALDPGLSPLHVSVKGMPGTPGYGIGHRDTFGDPDEGLRSFRAWGLPDDYLEYGEVPA